MNVWSYRLEPSGDGTDVTESFQLADQIVAQPLLGAARLDARQDQSQRHADHARTHQGRGGANGRGRVNEPVRYRSPDEDSGRWLEFPFRPGDIVISTRSKSGTTWVQMICALLVFQTARPARAARRDLAVARLGRHAASRRVRASRRAATPAVREDAHAARRNPDRPARDLHRRRPPSARHGRVALSPGRQPGSREDRAAHRSTRADATAVAAAARGVAADLDRLGRRPARVHGLAPRRDVAPLRRVGAPRANRTSCSCTTTTCRTISKARCAGSPGGSVSTFPRRSGPSSSHAAGFDQMRARADQLAPDAMGTLKDRKQFFRRGSSGAARELLPADQLARYNARAAELAPADLLAWLHR